MTTTQIHPFTRSGLGEAPFRFTGMTERRGPIVIANADGTRTEIGSHGQPMGSCDHCGTGIAYCFAIESADGKTSVVGSSCIFKTADRELAAPVKREVAKAQKANRVRRQVEANASRFEAEVARLGLADAIEAHHQIVKDIVRSARRYGRFASEAQIELLKKCAATVDQTRDMFANDPELAKANVIVQGWLADEGAERPERAGAAINIIGRLHQWGSISGGARSLLLHVTGVAPYGGTEGPGIDAPEGRQEFSGTVIATKEQHGDYGWSLKLIIEADAGYKVWVTCPAAIREVEKGQRVKFTATLTRSDRDPSFAFGKRPSKATIVKEGV